SAVQAALEEAKKNGQTVDLTVGPSWPAGVPSIMSDSPGALKELAYGIQTVAAGTTYTGAAPGFVIAPVSGVTQKQLLYVQAARAPPAGNPPTTAYTLDGSTVTNVPFDADGNVSWTALSSGNWILIFYWQRGVGQKPEAGPHTTPDSYVVDH